MGHVAVVTGGTRGLGEAISTGLQNAGYTVAAIYAGNDEATLRFKEKIGIATYKFNVSDFEACEKALEQITSEIGPVEILINNAGITKDGTMHRMSYDQWSSVIQTNLASCFNIARSIMPLQNPEYMASPRLWPRKVLPKALP